MSTYYSSVASRLAELEAEHHNQFEADWQAAENMNVGPCSMEEQPRQRDRTRTRDKTVRQARRVAKIARQMKQASWYE